MSEATRRIGVVAIGRNEGERLRRCLESAVGRAERVVYVDSGSTDGSIATAHALGAEVVELDTSIPFTAARARNAGAARLLEIESGPEFIQFVDGDCEIAEGWLEAASAEMVDRSGVAIVCGRRRERFPEASIYNALCDIEWNTQVGEALYCGGDALMRASVFREVGGFSEALIAGEEPELCVRVREAGWKVFRIDHEMTLHDAAMTTFSQWWKRAKRGGYAYAEGAQLHGRSPHRHWVRERNSALFWGLLLPAVSVLAAPFTYGVSLALLLGHPLLVFRIYRWRRRRGDDRRRALLYAAFCALAKFAETAGQATYWWRRLSGRRATLIEYKQADVAHSRS